MKAVLFVLAVTTAIRVLANDNLADDKLNGRPQSLKEYTYKVDTITTMTVLNLVDSALYDKNGELIYKQSFYPNDLSVDVKRNIYDDIGHLITSNNVFLHGGNINDTSCETVHNIYEDGKLVGSNETTVNGFLKFSSSYIYDEAGRLKEVNVYQEKSYELFRKKEYPEKNKEIISFYTKGKLDFKSVWERDDAGNVLSFAEYSVDEKYLGGYENQYNSQRKLIKEAYYGKDHIVKGGTSLKYDEHGNEIERIEVDAIGEGIHNSHTVYNYDKQNNYTQKEIYYNGKLSSIIKREITYQ